MSGIRGKRYIDEDGNEVLTGGLRAAATNKAKYGDNFYARIGRIGGEHGRTGGFASNPELARLAGAKGGRKSKRGKAGEAIWHIEKNRKTIAKLYRKGNSIPQIATKLNLSQYSLRTWAKENLDGYGEYYYGV